MNRNTMIMLEEARKKCKILSDHRERAAEIQKNLATKNDEAEKERISLLTEMNKCFLDRATAVIQTLCGDPYVQAYLDLCVDKSADASEEQLYLVLAGESQPAQEHDPRPSSLMDDVDGGSSQSVTSHHLALEVPLVGSQPLWRRTHVKFCQCRSTISPLSREWAPLSRPSFEDHTLLLALLYLQTEKSALFFIVNKFGESRIR